MLRTFCDLRNVVMWTTPSITENHIATECGYPSGSMELKMTVFEPARNALCSAAVIAISCLRFMAAAGAYFFFSCPAL